MSNNTTQLELLSRDNEKIHHELNDSKLKFASETNTNKGLQKRVIEVEETLKYYRQEINEKINESRDQSVHLRQSNKSEIQAVLKVNSDLNMKIEEMSSYLSERVKLKENDNEQRIGEINRVLSRMQQEFQV